MAKKKSDGDAAPQNGDQQGAGGESVMGYFRRIFKENPKLLENRSNAELLRRWLADHPGETEVPQRVKGGLSNVKSILRSKGRKKTAAKAAKAETEPQTSKAAAPSSHMKTKLEKLEEQIDDCLTYARTLDRTGLEDIINHLRRARNTVVWKMGQ